jgi:chorismate mutase / prephenate dehydratase
MDDLNSLRDQIDHLDEQIIELINRRAQISRKIGNIKQEKNQNVFQPEREQSVINHVKSLAKEISPQNAEFIWKEIMSACKQVQGKNPIVAYFGQEGSFSQIAAQKFFPKANITFLAGEKTQEIFQRIENGTADFGVVPVENSLQGSVPETLDCLIEKNVTIYGEIELRVSQNLIGLPGDKIENIKTVYSHPQALAQTAEWLKKNIPRADLVEFSSTAKAVKKIQEMKDPTSAAIGTELAAKLYNLEVLAPCIEDNSANFTRFLVISNQKPSITPNDKTSMVFVVKHVPGALFNILKYFAESKINLAKIESRPRKVEKGSIWNIFLFWISMKMLKT